MATEAIAERSHPNGRHMYSATIGPHRTPTVQLAATIAELRGAFDAGWNRFMAVQADDDLQAKLKVPPHEDARGNRIAWTLNVRRDIDLLRSADKELLTLTAEGFCMQPWCGAGDVLFFSDMDCNARDGDVILMRLPAHETFDNQPSFMVKVLHRYRDERWLLLSNEPPLNLASMNSQATICGVMVAFVHYEATLPRSAAVNAKLSLFQKLARAARVDWSADYLDSVLGTNLEEC